jgi:hypothetical protein
LYFVFPIFEFYFICYFVLHILACLNSIRMYLVIMYTLVVLIKYFLWVLAYVFIKHYGKWKENIPIRCDLMFQILRFNIFFK